jgi:beta-galactosidase
MKVIALLFTFFICVSVTNGQKKPAETLKNQRVEKIINSQWTFNYFPVETADKGYESPRFDDSRWSAISVPHTWNTYETTGELHPFIKNASENDDPYWWTGWGWYRKHFSINKEYADRKVFIEFEGVQKYCKVWINGKYLGDHKGGYGSFDFDLTQYLIPDGDNVIAVAVNNSQNDKFKIPPMAAGNFNVYGGIYRDVTIVLKNKLYIPMQGSASHEGGTYVTTPRLSAKEGVVRVQTWVKNDNPEKKICSLQTSIFDANNRIVQVLKTNAEINPGQEFKFDQSSKPVQNPHLWSSEDPYLYRIYSEVIDGKDVADTYTSPLGFRWFRWDYDENFLYVNDKKMVIHGGNRHQEYPWLGDAIPKWITIMDYTDIAENLNYNFMRTAHYPNDNLVYDLTDKYGIVIDEETPSIKNQDFSVEVQEQQMKEMIRRDRNHPSIMLWSMGNETNHAVDSKFAVAEDTTRILTARRVTEGSAGKYVKHTDENLAIENLLRCTIRGWYNMDVKDLEPTDSQHCGTEEHQMNMLKASGRFGTGNLCTWLYEDHGADREYLNSPLLHVNPKGYVDVYRVPKYAYYFWQATYSKKPMVFILPHFWRPQYLGQKKDIVVNSNCDRVELKVNGVSKGSQIPDATNFHSVTFKDIEIEKGILTAIASKNGATVTTQLVMAGDPAKIVLKSSQNKLTADRGSVAIITADIVDSKGIHVYGAANTIKWTVTGPGKLVGPSIFETDINKHHEMEGVWYMDMPVSNVIRSTGKGGKIHIVVSAGGIASAAIDIDSEEFKPDDSVIHEPLLGDDGRKPVAKSDLKIYRLEEVPREINFTFDEFSLPKNDKAGFSKILCEYILKNNPSVDTSQIEFKALIELFSTQLMNNDGHLIADDYNYSVDHFNTCRLISRYVASTKLPALFKEGLRRYYSNSIIMQGSEKNTGDEMNWLNWIPSGGTVVVYGDAANVSALKGAVFTNKSDLADLIAVVYPAFMKFSDETKQRDLEFIARMNPYIHVNAVSEQSIEGNKEKITKVSYKAEKGQPILIPLLKFISE